MSFDKATVDDAYLNLLDDVEFRPVFIMGDHRSGTTLLYQLLQASGHFNVVQAYHIVRREEILYNAVNGCAKEAYADLDRYLNGVQMTDRVLDEVQVSASLPEEYGFVLEDGQRPQLTDENLPRFLRFCRKVQYAGNCGSPLLLKNPWDFTNFRFVKDRLPQARFIFLHRHPVALINSQIKAARALYASKSHYHALLDETYDQLWERPLRLRLTQALFSSRFSLGLRVARRHVARATAYFLEQVPWLPTADYTSVRFEELCAEPSRAIGRILDFLDLERTPCAIYDDLVKPRQNQLLDEVRRQQAAIIAEQREYLSFCDYNGNPVATGQERNRYAF